MLNQNSPKALYGAYFLLTLLIINQTKEFSLYDQSDFNRVIGYFFGEKVFIGQYTKEFLYPIGFNEIIEMKDLSSSLLLFGLGALLQSLYSEFFNLLTFAYWCKFLLSLALLYLGLSTAKSLGATPRDGCIIACFYLIIAFLPYNIALLNTLYTEYALYLFLPVMLALIIRDKEGNFNATAIFIVAVICGAAKTQFFYIPALLAVVLLFLNLLSGKKSDKMILIGLAVAQFICFVPLISNQYKQTNYYHSLYLGSYLFASQDTLLEIGLNHESIACIGTDAWGNHLGGLSLDRIVSVKPSCIDMKPITTSDILDVYIREPASFFKLLNATLPVHFTTQYFHVDKSITYLYSIERGNSNGYERGHFLIKIMDIRESVSYIMVPLVLLFSIYISIFTRVQFGIRAALLFLSLFVVSQVIISILGEGIRDLSRHLSMAQYTIDLTLIMLVATLYFRIFTGRITNSKS